VNGSLDEMGVTGSVPRNAAPRPVRTLPWILGLLLAVDVVALPVLAANAPAILDRGLVAAVTVRTCTYQGPAFDPTLWDVTTQTMCNCREAMTSDLIDNYLRQGMDKSKVVALLGPPDDDSPPPYSVDAEAWYLGSSSFFHIYGDWLVVEFDDAGLLTRVYLSQY
jgi:hypothetical protein